MSFWENRIDAPDRGGCTVQAYHKTALRRNELVYYYALDRKWMSTDQAAILLRRAEEAELLRQENGIFTILFDPATVPIPIGFRPTSAIFEANDPVQELIGRIMKTRGAPETDVVAEMNTIIRDTFGETCSLRQLSFCLQRNTRYPMRTCVRP
ncbi:MAG: DUF2240 family protein [Methanoregula sp.]